MSRFIGEVKPIYGRWTFPYKVMEVGDYFIVNKTLRDPETLRAHAGIRAAQLGIWLSVTKHPPEHPGYTRVMRVPRPEERPIEKYVQVDPLDEIMS